MSLLATLAVTLSLFAALSQADVKHILPQANEADQNLNAITPDQPKGNCCNQQYRQNAAGFATGASFSGTYDGGHQAHHAAFTALHPGNPNTQFTPNDLAFWWLGKDSPFLQAYEYFKKCTEKGNCAVPAAAPGSLPPRQGCNANGCSSSGSFSINEQASGGQKTGPFNPSSNPFLNGDFQGIAISSENGKPVTTITTCKGPKCQTNSINGIPNTPIDLASNPFFNGAVPNTQGASLAGAASSGSSSTSPNPFAQPNNPFFVHGGGNGLPPCVHGPQGSFYPGQNGQPGQFVPNPGFPGNQNQGPPVIPQGGSQEPEKTDFSNNPFLSGSVSSGSQTTGGPSFGGPANPQGPAKAVCKGTGAICVPHNDCVDGLVSKHAEGYYQVKSDIQYCDTNNGEVCCKLPKKQPQNVFIQGNSASNGGFVSGNGDKSSVNFGDITGVIPGQNTIKIPGGPGISPGVIHVVPDNSGAASTVAPSISNYGQSGSFNLRPANPPSGFVPAASTISPNSVAVSNGNPFSTTIDYSNIKFSASEINQAAAAANNFQGPGYLPPDLPTPPPTRPPTPYRPPTTPYRPPQTPPPTPYRPPQTPPPTPYRPPQTQPTTQYRPPSTYPTTPYRPPTTYPTTPYRPPSTYPTTPRTTPRAYTSPAPVNIFTNPPASRPTQGGYSYPVPTPTFNPYEPAPAGNVNQYVSTTQRTQGYSYNTPTPAFTFPPPTRPPPSPPRTNNEYLPPDGSSNNNIYQPSTPRPFVPPPQPITTRRPYVPPPQPPTTTYRPYVPPSTTQPPRTTQRYIPPPTTTYRPYVPPSTTQRPYVPPQTTQRPYVPPQTTQRPYVPPQTTQRPYVPPQTTQRPYVPPQTTQRPYVPPSTTRKVFVPSTYLPPQPPSPDYDGAGNSINGQYVGPPTQAPTYLPPPVVTPQRPQPTPYDPDRYGDADGNAGQAIGFPTTPRPVQPPAPRPRPIQPPQDPQDPGLPYAGCAAALVCVQEIYCSAEGVISATPVVLTKEQEANKVPTTDCQDKQAGIIGKCCRDPNYKDPWPSTKLDKNGFDDGQYHEDDSIAQYQPSKNLQGAASNRYRKRENQPNQIAASINQQPQGQPPQQQQQQQVAPSNGGNDPNAQPQGPFYSHISNPSCGQRHANTNPRGTGPNEVNFAEITWQAMILRDSNRSLLCGGAIIRLDAVLTAAHCVEGMDSSDVLIKGGEWKLGIDEEPQPFQIVKVAAIIRHPQYVPGNKQNDLVILKLTERLRPAKNVGTICLGQIGQPVLDENCIATGWGKKILQLHLQGAIMRSVDVNLLSSQECEAKLQQTPQILQDYTQRHLCGQSKQNQCDIDIGSALACRGSDGRYSLSGILTWDTGCRNPDQIGGYLAPDTTWIESTLSRQINDLRNEERQYNSRLQS